MKFLYIGQYSDGTTSKMRAVLLRKLLPDADFRVIDTHVPFYDCPAWWRSFGFRFKRGLLISKINRYILEQAGNEQFDCIWTDKAVFITRETTKFLRNHSPRLVHFTPDPAFTFHRSKHFLLSLPLYDFAVTSKSYELEHYRNILEGNKVLVTTQGFDPSVHHPVHPFAEKKTGVTFVGHHEKEREEILGTFLSEGIPVIVAGRGWGKFAKQHAQNPLLEYRGEGVYGADYARLISGYSFSLGLLSRWVPEKHTTRTFEIPACGTALVTEYNEETSRFFRDDEAIFYNSLPEMVTKIKYYLSHPSELKELTCKGRQRVISDGRDYETILRGLLGRMGILTESEKA